MTIDDNKTLGDDQAVMMTRCQYTLLDEGRENQRNMKRLGGYKRWRNSHFVAIENFFSVKGRRRLIKIEMFGMVTTLNLG